MTVLASRSAYDDYDEDYRSDLDAKYEEGFGHGPDLGYEDEDDFDELFAGLFDGANAADDDDEDGPALASAPKSPAAKKTAATAAKGIAGSGAKSGKRTTAASPVVIRTVTPVGQAKDVAPVGQAMDVTPVGQSLGKDSLAAAPVVGTSRVSASGVVVTLASPTRLVVTKADPEAAALAPHSEPENGVEGEDRTGVNERETAVCAADPAAVDPAIRALAEAASRARVAAESATNAAKRAVMEAVAKAAAAKAAAAEASAAEQAAQAALTRSTEAEAAARTAAEKLAEAQQARVAVTEISGTLDSPEAPGISEAAPTDTAQDLSAGAAPADPGQSSAAPTKISAPADPAQSSAAPTGAAPTQHALEEASGALEPGSGVVRAIAPVTDPLFGPAIAPVNEHVDFLRRLRPGFEVPYVDPMHSAEECRIVSLFSNTGEANPRGFVWAGDDAAATRLLGLQYQLGLRPEWIIPWNVYPWFTPGEANGKLAPEQVQAGLKPLLALLKVLPRASAIVAHGPEANRLAQMLLKTSNPLIWRRGLKVYKARSLHGRAFAGSKERQTEWLIDMGKAYADAMARAGVQLRRG